MTPQPPCRLFVILARSAPVGVIFRRGPSKLVQIIRWNTETDEFTPGQWFRGRIYQKRCDLSPSGSLLIYFAVKHKEPLYSWTAVSKPPYLSALVLWPKGDSWDGGGLFEAENRIWLNHPSGEAKIQKGSIPPEFLVCYKEDCYSGEDEPIYSKRLERDGWHKTQHLEVEETTEKIDRQWLEPIRTYLENLDWDDETREYTEKLLSDLSDRDRITTTGYVTHKPEIRQQKGKGLTLEAQVSLEGFDRIERYSVTREKSEKIVLDGSEWAEFDQSGRLVFAKDGKLLEGKINKQGILEESELAEFNDARFEPITSPDWARQW